MPKKVLLVYVDGDHFFRHTLSIGMYTEYLKEGNFSVRRWGSLFSLRIVSLHLKAWRIPHKLNDIPRGSFLPFTYIYCEEIIRTTTK